ncbi:hypothetical protein NDU88_001687 [Pleurodeles waltl]|uniref:Uncharacterized protein n=1 Tax=Pleurodeles waltl TaxID=8319 RepID=A0AAV7RDJ7_PLEWA|nr:hypothetical protein NDU88_001687 [Pleurodeles waltl]
MPHQPPGTPDQKPRQCPGTPSEAPISALAPPSETPTVPRHHRTSCKPPQYPALPPHLPQLKDVDDRLPDPDREPAEGQGPGVGDGGPDLADGGARGAHHGGPPAAEPLHASQPDPAVILREPAEAERLHQQRGHQHQGQRQPEEGVVPPPVVVQRQPQVGAHVPEEDGQGQHDPQAVQPGPVRGRGGGGARLLAPPAAQQRAQAGAAAAPVAGGGVAAVADVQGAALALAGPRSLVQVVQLGEAAARPGAVRLRGHLGFLRESPPPPPPPPPGRTRARPASGWGEEGVREVTSRREGSGGTRGGAPWRPVLALDGSAFSRHILIQIN